MYIKDISISNFKSIASAEIDFSRLALLIGANAAGKSNLINVFRFLADIENNGLDYAIALQGGISYLRNASMPKDEPITIKFSIDFDIGQYCGVNGIIRNSFQLLGSAVDK